MPTVDLAGRLPEPAGRPVSRWDCTELARQRVADGVVAAISAAPVRRSLARHRRRPWRSHLGLHPRHPRAATLLAPVRVVADRYARPLGPDEVVIGLDEMTARAPRPRRAPTRPAQPGRPQPVEHEYRRDGALTVLAAFKTRDGSVSAYRCRRTRHVEMRHRLDRLAGQRGDTITTVQLVCDTVSTHKGDPIQTWLAAHPRFVIHDTPVHSSWMSQIEPWFSILARTPLRLPDCADLAAVAAALIGFIDDGNAHGHPFRGTAASFDTVITKLERALGLTSDREAACWGTDLRRAVLSRLKQTRSFDRRTPLLRI